MLETLDLEQVASDILRELVNAKRPVLIYGHGVKLAGAVGEGQEVADLMSIPIACTWATRDAFPSSIGAFGTHGVRHANFAVQKADYILCVGSRLDTKATGSPASAFAPHAKLSMVDVDPSELDKMANIGRPLYRKVIADAREFLRMLSIHARNYHSYQNDEGDDVGYLNPWMTQIKSWEQKYPVVLPEYRLEKLNPYAIVEKLGDFISKDDVIVSDTGCVLGWMMQAYKFKGERFIHAFNNTPMGYGLPAAIGAAFATGKKVVLVTGDGGLSVNITELATVARHNLPIKILLFNNRGHAMCRQTQRQWLGSEYPSTSYEGGLACPDFTEIAKAYGLAACSSRHLEDAGRLCAAFNKIAGPTLLELEIGDHHGIAGQVKYGEPLLAEAA